MTNEQFQKLVNQLETKAHENPISYRNKVVLLAALGYGYLIVVLGLLFGTLGLLVFLAIQDGIHYGLLRLFIFAAIITFYLLRSLIFKLEAPEGRVLHRNEAVELYRILDELKSKMKTPPIHTVLLTEEMNAEVTQLPKFGFFGPSKNYLLIGVPMLAALNPEQFRAVLAHEFAHISHQDTKIGSWIYRIRRSWGVLIDTMEQKKRRGAFLFQKFFNWYYPIFDAHAFVLSRMEEYRADSVAAEITSTKDKAEALIHIGLAAPFFYQDYYQDLLKNYADRKENPSPFSEFKSYYAGLSNEKLQHYLTSSLERITDVDDTHPSLTDRLKALNTSPYLPEQLNDSALAAFINEHEKIVEEFDQNWRERNTEHWNENREEYNSSLDRLHALEHSTPESIDDWFEYAALTERFHSSEKTVPLFEKIISLFPNEEQTAFAYSRIGEFYLFEAKQEEQKGLAYLEKSIELNWMARQNGLNALCHYYHQNGDTETFEKYLYHLEKWEETLQASEQETDYMYPTDDYSEHGLDGEAIYQIETYLMKFPEIKEAYLVRKNLKAIPERKLFVIGVVTDQEINPDSFFANWQLPDSSLLPLNENPELRKRLQEVQGASIY